MDTGQVLGIEDDSSSDSSHSDRFSRPRRATPLPQGQGPTQPKASEELSRGFTFREDQFSLKDEGEEDDDSLSFATKQEFVKKQPRRLYSKGTGSVEGRAHSTASETMRKSSFKKPASERPGSLATPRVHSVIARNFLFPKRQKTLKPLPLVGNKTPRPVKAFHNQTHRGIRLRKYRKMLEEALREKAKGGIGPRMASPKTWKHENRSFQEDSELPLRGFQTSFPVYERKIPLYDAKRDKHVRLYLPKKGLKSQTQPRSQAEEMPKRNTVRFEDEVTHIDPQPSDSRKNLYLPKVLPQRSDRPCSAPHSQLPLPPVNRRDQHSVPRSRAEEQRVLERDWAKSALEAVSASANWVFNAEGNSAFMTEEQVTEVLTTLSLKTFTMPEMKGLIAKAQSTLSKLHEELLLPTHILHSVPISKEGLQSILFLCRSNLQLRSLILSILAAIHQREDSLLSLMALGEDAGPDFPYMFEEVMSLSKAILSEITQFRTLTQDEKFWYMETEYAEKIHEDSANLMTAFRHLLGGQRDYLNATITQEDLRGKIVKGIGA
jgi:hypothetical protein